MAKSFASSMRQLGRSLERSAKLAAREHQRLVREADRQQRAAQRAATQLVKEQKALYVEERITEAREKTEDIELAASDLQTILVDCLTNPVHLDLFDTAIEPIWPEKRLIPTPQEPAPVKLEKPAPSRVAIFLVSVIMSGIAAAIGGLFWGAIILAAGIALMFVDDTGGEKKRIDEANKLALEHYRAAMEQYRRDAEAVEREFEAEVHRAKQDADLRTKERLEWRTAFDAGNPEAVADYFAAVLAASDLPEGFPRDAEVQYTGASKQLLVNYSMPRMADIVPLEKAFKYTKSDDTITASMRPESQRKMLYAGAIAQTTLRCLNEIFQADMAQHVETVVFNGSVDTKDPATGTRIRPCLVSVRVTTDKFAELDLNHVEPQACLQALSASFSKSPAELAPVRPILELNMSDPRFIQETDVISALDDRPNLMDLSPGEFEALITNLFQKMGLETKLTQASRDGGVDCVAFDPRPIFGGKVVIQAKRYKHTVGVSSVRDLFGTMQNEGASKGILVATSGYGKASFDFANGKPIELLDGGNLLYLLKEHAGIDARIVMPQAA